jgi:hypothetical protein
MRKEPDSVTFALRASSVMVERSLAVLSWQLLLSLLCVWGVHLFPIQRRISVSGRPQQRRETMSVALSNPLAESFCALSMRSRDFGIIIKLDSQKGKNRRRWTRVRSALHMHCCNAGHDAFHMLRLGMKDCKTENRRSSRLALRLNLQWRPALQEIPYRPEIH